jgi:LPS sulfotransferase NodH
VSSEPEAGLLAHTLADTGYAGRPSDYFDDAERENHTREWGLPACQLTTYVRAMWDRATTPNGVLGSKLMWNNFDSLRSVRYRKQADSLTERYVDLVHSAMSSPG